MSICFGKISLEEKPKDAASPLNVFCINAADTAFSTNKNKCAPPDFDLHITIGIFKLLIFCKSVLWSSLYSSTSIHPQ